MRALNTSLKNISLKGLALALSLTLTAPAAAQTKKAAGKPAVKAAPVAAPAAAAAPTPVVPVAPAGKGDQVDISDIENKYWAPKDTDFNVVQNRTYTKEKRLAISAQYGPVINDTFNEGNAGSLGLNYFFTERWGLQLNYTMFSMKNSDATNGFIAQGGSPNYGTPSNMYDLGINWIPFYAKMSVMGKKIIYFDMAFTPTVGMMNYEARTDQGNSDKSSLTYGFDVTQYFFIHKNFAVRVDLKQRWYKEEIVLFHGPGNVGTGGKVKDKNSDNTTLLIGGAVFF